MIIHNVGYNHCHDADFFIDRPDGSGDYLLLVLKTDTIFTLDGKDTIVPKNSFFLYKRNAAILQMPANEHIFKRLGSFSF